MERVTTTATNFATLTPIIAGRELELDRYLRSLPGGGDGPFADVPGTHFARFALLPELVYNGPPQKPDTLKSEYLLFTATYDGELEDWLQVLTDRLGDHVVKIWGCCAGFERASSLSHYLRHNQLADTAFLFAAYVGSVEDVRRSVDVRRRLRAFVRDHQGVDDPVRLRDEWRREFGAPVEVARGTYRPVEAPEGGPDEAAGVPADVSRGPGAP